MIIYGISKGVWDMRRDPEKRFPLKSGKTIELYDQSNKLYHIYQ